MSFLSKLFGKKKQAEPVASVEKEKTDEAKKIEALKEEARHITLEDVEKELDTIDAEKAVDEAPAHEEEKPVAKAEGKSVYHIKKHAKGWQVIAEGADRAYRVFETQKEAIDFAKENDMEYLLYRVDGTLRQ